MQTTDFRHERTESRLESSPLVRKTRCCINIHGLQRERPSLSCKKKLKARTIRSGYEGCLWIVVLEA